MRTGRKIYFDLSTGSIIQETPQGDVVETTPEQDFASYVSLSERIPETVGKILLPYGLYQQDFLAMRSYKINQINEPFTTPLTVEYDADANKTVLYPSDDRYRYGCAYTGAEIDGAAAEVEIDAYGGIVVDGQAAAATISGTKTVEIVFDYTQPTPTDPTPAPIYQQPLSVQVEQLKEQVNPKNPDEIFLSLDVANTSLDDLKAKKIDQLNYLCNQSILAGFSSSALGDVHQYPFSEVDQLNYAGTLSLMNADSTLDSISWKTLDIGVQTHSKAQFNTVCKDSFSHKQTKIAQYWQLKESAQNALSKDEVLNINWS